MQCSCQCLILECWLQGLANLSQLSVGVSGNRLSQTDVRRITTVLLAAESAEEALHLFPLFLVSDQVCKNRCHNSFPIQHDACT